MRIPIKSIVSGFLVAMALVFSGPADVAAAISGLNDLLDPTVVVGTTISVPSPPSDARDRDQTTNSVELVRAEMVSRMGPGSIYEQLQPNWPSSQHSTATLAEIGAVVQQNYDSLIAGRMATPAVECVEVENLTLVYPDNYYLNVQPVTVHAKRVTLQGADGRTLVGYYVNYDKIEQFNNSVVFQVNGRFGRNPTWRGLGMEDNGGVSGAALGKIAMQGLPISTVSP